MYRTLTLILYFTTYFNGKSSSRKKAFTLIQCRNTCRHNGGILSRSFTFLRQSCRKKEETFTRSSLSILYFLFFLISVSLQIFFLLYWIKRQQLWKTRRKAWKESLAALFHLNTALIRTFIKLLYDTFVTLSLIRVLFWLPRQLTPFLNLLQYIGQVKRGYLSGVRWLHLQYVSSILTSTGPLLDPSCIQLKKKSQKIYFLSCIVWHILHWKLFCYYVTI